VVVSVLSVAVLRIAGSDSDAVVENPRAFIASARTTRRLRSELGSLENLVDGRWREQLEES